MGKCKKDCFERTIVTSRATGDFDGGCHWWAYHPWLKDGERAWVRKWAGDKASGTECSYKGMSQKELNKLGHF